MKLATIICEYNPFHSGHRYHLDRTRQLTSCDALVCIMSGNFTQRGELAIMDKYTRAKHAILGGADIVVELPTLYATSSAQYFASGAIELANLIPNNAYLSFGSESGDISSLLRLLPTLQSEDYKRALAEYSAQGLSYQVACESAYKRVTGESSPMTTPNNVLAVEYLRALQATHSTIEPMTIKRIGGEYHDTTLLREFSSASAIREAISRHDDTSINVPTFVEESLANLPKIDLNRLFAIVCSKLVDNSDDIYEGLEGLDNRLRAMSRTANDYDELIRLTHTKRYSLSRIKRLVLHTLLGHTPTLLSAPIDYTNVLAIRRDKLDLLSLFPHRRSSSALYANDMYANDMYGIISGSRIIRGSHLIVD